MMDHRWLVTGIWCSGVLILAVLGSLVVPQTVSAKQSAPPWGHPKAWDIPARGDGTFQVVDGASPVVGTGRHLRFVVEVEEGVGENPERFATIVEEILFDPRGWAGTDTYALQRVSSGPVDFRVTLASPETVDQYCAPLETKGKFSCWNGNRAMINLWRWYSGHPIFSSLSNYRAHVINHEVGHALDYRHNNQCPRSGAPAPIMMQQTIDLDGCSSNAWVKRGTNHDSLKRAYARVHGETLYYSQLARSSPPDRTSPERLAEGSGKTRKVSAEKLYRIVFRFLYYDYLDEHGIAANDTEARRLARTLENRIYWLSDGSELQGFLKTYVRNWKFRQRIYSQFGGDVRRGMFGFIPVDAYRTFLRNRNEAGEFEIYLPDLKKRFWSINPHSTLFLSAPIRRERVGQVINNPPWMNRRFFRGH